MIRLGVLYIARHCLNQSRFQIQTVAPVIKPNGVNFVPSRTTSFFSKVDGDTAWKYITSVSNAGRKRGRAKSLRRKINLNRGQSVGRGEVNVKWPGLNALILDGQDLTGPEKLQSDPKYKENLIAQRESVRKRVYERIHPLRRGWSGKQICGQYLGPPDPVGNETFEGFETVVLAKKVFTKMTGNMGRKKFISVTVAVGNFNGLLGIHSAEALEAKSALAKAKNVAVKRLVYYKLEDGHTVNHDFYSEYGNARLMVKKQNKEYGLVCHRAIAECCKLIGIKDLYAKVERSRNTWFIVKAFLLGLMSQKTYQELADEKKLHLVEIRKENLNYPVVLASPKEVAKTNDTLTDSFIQHIMGGKIPLKKKRKHQAETTAFFDKHIKKTYFRRNHEEVRLKLWAKYGEYRSYLYDVYPECRREKISKTHKNNEGQTID
ncbi:UNVERIFIED_CONTAM: hypothetical protein PYX00_007694 [Menopon gallinae]|uniref:Small ribosomal subunit protein uS5m n=1 Tax=Menopon gallinae TaxID=328185 RepID=A0AAW2HKB3_9NEOP